MDLSRNMCVALILAAVFASTFIIVFIVISSIQSAYSTPDTYVTAMKDLASR